MERNLSTWLLVLVAVSLVFLVNYYVTPTWSARGVVVLVLVGAGYLLRPHMALVPGIFTIPGDILLIDRSPTALDFLVWAGLVALPYGLSILLEKQEEQAEVENETREVASPSSGSVKRSDDGALRSSDVDTEDHEAFERLQWLVKRRLKLARALHGFNVLLLYKVEQKEASLSYAIDPENVVNRDVTFQADTGQGIGWVLRHNDELVQSDQQIDWRNLQYRTQPGDLARVRMVPLYYNDKMSGILVMEWKSDPATDDALTDFVNEVEHLMGLRREIHQLEKNQDVLQLMEKLHELNPLEETRFDSMIHRSLEIVRAFIPVDEGHVEFFHYEDTGGDGDVVHQGRRAVYEEGMKWIKESEEILRIGDFSNHSLGSQSLNRFGQVDLRSFLGGPVEKDGDLVGMICLDHPQPDYFTRQDAELLRILLDQLSHVLRVGRRLDQMEKKQSEYRRLLDVFQLEKPGRSLESVIERQTERLKDNLPIMSAGYYTYEAGDYQLLSYSGDGEPSGQFDREHAMVRRIQNAETTTTMLSFPDLNRFEGYEAPLNAEGLKVALVSSGERIQGFFTLFVNNVEKLDDVLFEELERILPLLLVPIRLMHERNQLKEANKKDPITGLVRFEAWKSELSTRVESDAPETLVMWYVRVPGFEEIAEERGRERARNWLKSVSRLLNELLEESVITRSYAGTFMGFQAVETEEMEERLTTVVDRLSDWSFPTGSWPRSPQCGYTHFTAPFPSIRKLIDAPFKRTPDNKSTRERG